MRGAPNGASKLLASLVLATLSLFTSFDDAGARASTLPLTTLRALPSSPKLLEFIDTAPAETAAPVLEAEPWPPDPARLIELVEATWPEDPRTAVRVLLCESQAGTHPDTYSLTAANGGPMQLNRYTWKAYFEANYGWSWEQVVTDIGIHLRAARHIYDRARGWGPWRCY